MITPLRFYLLTIFVCAFCFGGDSVHAQPVLAIGINQSKSSAPVSMEIPRAITGVSPQSVVMLPIEKPTPRKPSNIGAQAAMMAAVGGVKQPKLSYVGAALVGLTAIMNNNNNDGRPATYTGGDGSNFAAGG